MVRRFNQDLQNDLARQRKRTREEAPDDNSVPKQWKLEGKGQWTITNHKYHKDFDGVMFSTEVYTVIVELVRK